MPLEHIFSVKNSPFKNYFSLLFYGIHWIFHCILLFALHNCCNYLYLMCFVLLLEIRSKGWNVSFHIFCQLRAVTLSMRNYIRDCNYTGWLKKFGTFFVRLITLNIDQFFKRFHCQNQEKIYNNTVTKVPTIRQMCRYTTLWNVNVLKQQLKTRLL